MTPAPGRAPVAVRELLREVLRPGAGGARLPALPLAQWAPDPELRRRRRAGQAISTAFVESLVNALLSKRFAKKQSMQWTPGGAHLLLQVRTRTLNDDLAAIFRTWCPAFSLTDQPAGDSLLAA